MVNVKDAVLACIKDVPDFPKAGIVFKDITPLLEEPAVFGLAVDWMATQVSNVDVVVGLESRGFLFGVPVSQKLGVPFVPARKQGKLPRETYRESYQLEYGEATLEIHKDAIPPGANVLICDDLLATGGTASAAVALVERAGASVAGCVFLIELDFLNGKNSSGISSGQFTIFSRK